MKEVNSIQAYKVAEDFEYKKWVEKIPFIKFPKDWEVQIIPPFGCAIVRFRIKNGGYYLSVYLDCYDVLGYFGEPYWEIYPYEDDIYRCAMNNIDELLKKIGESLTQQSKKG